MRKWLSRIIDWFRNFEWMAALKDWIRAQAWWEGGGLTMAGSIGAYISDAFVAHWPLFVMVPFAAFCFVMAILDRRKRSNPKASLPAPKPAKKKAWEVPGSAVEKFMLYEAACMLAGDEPTWPLPTSRSRDQYNLLERAVSNDELGADLAYSLGSFEADNEAHKLQIKRRKLRRYLKARERPIPEFLKKRFDRE